MRKGLGALTALVLLGIASALGQSEKPAQQDQKPAGQAAAAPATPAYVIPPEAAKQANPVKSTPASITEGKKMYGFDCAMCHGESGDGKGELAGEMKLELKDYRDAAALKVLSDGEMFYIIQKGKGQMTGEGERQKPDEIWNMINFIRSLAKKNPKPIAN
jgi:mono/diheme cytochrome c family protein